MRGLGSAVLGLMGAWALPAAALAQPELRAAPEASQATCSDAATTLDMNQCMAAILAKAEAERQRYAKAAYARIAERSEVLAEFAYSEASFSQYRDAECGAVYEQWKGGSIRGVMSLSCKIELTDQRTHKIWQNWLTFMDSTPPMLPEPEPSI